MPGSVMWTETVGVGTSCYWSATDRLSSGLFRLTCVGARAIPLCRCRQYLCRREGFGCVYRGASQNGVQILWMRLGLMPIVATVGGLPEYQPQVLPPLGVDDVAGLTARSTSFRPAHRTSQGAAAARHYAESFAVDRAADGLFLCLTIWDVKMGGQLVNSGINLAGTAANAATATSARPLSRARPRPSTADKRSSQRHSARPVPVERGPSVTVLKVARDLRGATELRTQRKFVAGITNQSGLDHAWRELLPRVLSFDERATRPYASSPSDPE